MGEMYKEVGCPNPVAWHPAPDYEGLVSKHNTFVLGETACLQKGLFANIPTCDKCFGRLEDKVSIPRYPLHSEITNLPLYSEHSADILL